MSNNEPRISVVLPVFNAEKYLAEALESVLAQTYPVFEIILVDDGSTDGSAKVAEKFGEIIRYSYQVNQGHGSALNVGFAQATGDYIAPMDADDIWVKDKIAWQLAEFREDPILDMVFGHLKHFISPELDEAVKQKISCPPDPMPAYSAPATLLKRGAFSRVGSFDENWKVGQFMDWVIRAGEAGLASKILPEVICYRRLHTSNMMIRLRDNYNDYVHIVKASLDRRRRK